jgi:hypothetical protein
MAGFFKRSISIFIRALLVGALCGLVVYRIVAGTEIV